MEHGNKIIFIKILEIRKKQKEFLKYGKNPQIRQAEAADVPLKDEKSKAARVRQKGKGRRTSKPATEVPLGGV